jgi:hypothetical protein
MPIDHINLSRIDLNLLVAFDALIRTRHKAAARVGIGVGDEPGLARLRSLFGDTADAKPEGIRPTPRALPRRPGADRALNIAALVGADTSTRATRARSHRAAGQRQVLIARSCWRAMPEAPGIRFRFY